MVGIINPRNFVYNHFSLRARLLQRATWCHGGYLRARHALPMTLPPTGPLNLMYTKFQDMKALETPPPPCNGATRPQCMYEESLWMIDKRVFLRRQPDHNRNLACTLTRDILKVAHCRLLTPGVGGHVGYWRLFGDNAGYLPRYPGGLHHPEEVVTPRIGKSNQPLAGGSVEGLWGIRCTI